MNIIALIPTILKVLFEIYKFVRELKKQGVPAAGCAIAMREARTKGDLTSMQEILKKLEQTGDCK